MQIDLGDKVKDLITGFSGIVTSRTVYINGCIQYGVKSNVLKDGVPTDAQWFDEKQLRIVKKGVVAITPKLTGGPQEHPRT